MPVPLLRQDSVVQMLPSLQAIVEAVVHVSCEVALAPWQKSCVQPLESAAHAVPRSAALPYWHVYVLLPELTHWALLQFALPPSCARHAAAVTVVPATQVAGAVPLQWSFCVHPFESALHDVVLGSGVKTQL